MMSMLAKVGRKKESIERSMNDALDKLCCVPEWPIGAPMRMPNSGIYKIKGGGTPEPKRPTRPGLGWSRAESLAKRPAADVAGERTPRARGGCRTPHARPPPPPPT